jgi:hypothetical protein
LRDDFDIVNVRIMENIFLTYLFYLLLAFQLYQFHCNPISEAKVIIQTQTYAISKFESNPILTLNGEIPI